MILENLASKSKQAVIAQEEWGLWQKESKLRAWLSYTARQLAQIQQQPKQEKENKKSTDQ